ncbi:GCN5-related N-acetyltransferase [Parafrankia sp. EAN1pec]|uniref:GNAT family N-acetyltransferase n=1 Tax=Parafrankia sp. (strain EAN1pec) TaxID=298653 RepID=UPI0000544B06|nr:GCN5-related N-acetyltransferase [Frankia sp. EAN1pec]
MQLADPTVIEIPTVLTSRLVLRGWRAADVDPYTAMNSDPETMRYLDGTFGRDASERLVTHLIGMWVLLGHGMWAVEDRRTGEFLGRAGLYFGPGWPGIEVAVSICRDRWGQGLGTEACQAALDWGFGALAVDQIVTFTNRGNAGMNAIARKLDMAFQGEADKIGPWADNNVYAITREDWAARRQASNPAGRG